MRALTRAIKNFISVKQNATKNSELQTSPRRKESIIVTEYTGDMYVQTTEC